jgi:hypothetical protein
MPSVVLFSDVFRMAEGTIMKKKSPEKLLARQDSLKKTIGVGIST